MPIVPPIAVSLPDTGTIATVGLGSTLGQALVFRAVGMATGSAAGRVGLVAVAIGHLIGRTLRALVRHCATAGAIRP